MGSIEHGQEEDEEKPWGDDKGESMCMFPEALSVFTTKPQYLSSKVPPKSHLLSGYLHFNLSRFYLK